MRWNFYTKQLAALLSKTAINFNFDSMWKNLCDVRLFSFTVGWVSVNWIEVCLYSVSWKIIGWTDRKSQDCFIFGIIQLSWKWLKTCYMSDGYRWCNMNSWYKPEMEWKSGEWHTKPAMSTKTQENLPDITGIWLLHSTVQWSAPAHRI